MYLSPNTALEILDTAEELELICMQLKETKENTVPQKCQRKKSRDKVHLQNPPCFDSPAFLNPS